MLGDAIAFKNIYIYLTAPKRALKTALYNRLNIYHLLSLLQFGNFKFHDLVQTLYFEFLLDNHIFQSKFPLVDDLVDKSAQICIGKRFGNRYLENSAQISFGR